MSSSFQSSLWFGDRAVLAVAGVQQANTCRGPEVALWEPRQEQVIIDEIERNHNFQFLLHILLKKEHHHICRYICFCYTDMLYLVLLILVKK